MTDLLELAIKAHGGMDRWDQLTSVEGQFSIGGAIWGFKGVPGVFGDITVALDLHTERVTIDPVAGLDTRTVFAEGLEFGSAGCGVDDVIHLFGVADACGAAELALVSIAAKHVESQSLPCCSGVAAVRVSRCGRSD